MVKKTILILSVSLLWHSMLLAEMYKWVDENSTIHFSDAPPQKTDNYKIERQRSEGTEVIKPSEEIGLTGEDYVILEEAGPNELPRLKNLKITLEGGLILYNSLKFLVEYDFDGNPNQRGLIEISPVITIDSPMTDKIPAVRASVEPGMHKLEDSSTSYSYYVRTDKLKKTTTNWLRINICLINNHVCNPVYQRVVPLKKTWNVYNP